jgi:hypothetical protein
VNGYGGVDLPLTDCVHFVRTGDFDGSQEQAVEAAVRKGMKLVYWDYLDGGSASATIATPLGRALELAYTPYGNLPWTQFLDDLITLSFRYPGLVIVIDHADSLLRERAEDMFDLIEAFLTQFHHWYDKKKPCHMCFQMGEHGSVRRAFGRGANIRRP